MKTILLGLFLFSLPSYGMKYVKICKAPNDCKEFSRLVMGTDHLLQGDWTHKGQPQPTRKEAFVVLDEAVRLGINFFDTSPIYVGDAENTLGEWKRSKSEELYILSKGGFPFDLYWAKHLEKGTHSPELQEALKGKGFIAGTYASRLYGDREQIVERVSEELGHTTKNLDNDITIYLMHRDDGDAVDFKEIERKQTPVRTILEALSAEKVASKFWMLGWSNWKTDRIKESIRLAKEVKGLQTPVISSPYFSLFEMSKRSIHALGVQVTHDEMMDPGFQKGIKIMPYSPLGGFSILDKPEPQWKNAMEAAREKAEQINPDGTKGDPYWRNVYPALFTPANEARWHRVVAFTKTFNQKHGSSYTVDQMINAYALAHPRTDFLAIGAITIEQVQRTVEALELSKQLTPRDLEKLYRGK